jgi:hypothetical protein
MLATLRDLTVNRDGTQNVTFTVAEDFTKTFDDLKGNPVNVEVKKAQKGRSKDANAMCWAMCADIGKAMTPPLAKEEVYRMAIKAVGVFTPVSVVCWDIPTIQSRWENHGIGWFVEIMDDAGIGRKLINLYYGSSTYTVDEMKVLLDWLVDQCEQMQIKIPLSKKEEAELLERWGKR